MSKNPIAPQDAIRSIEIAVEQYKRSGAHKTNTRLKGNGWILIFRDTKA